MRRGWADDLRRLRELYSKKPKEEEEDDDCVILDGDPNKAVEQVRNELANESDELVVVAEKGQIACRDYPHARHLCVTFPFNTNPHEKYCGLCHCYVCDTLAPCVYWVTGKSSDDHCHSTDKEKIWRELRHRSMEGKLAQLQVSGLLETTLSNEPLRHQALNCSQPLNVNEERVVQLDLMSLALDRSTVQGDRLTGIVKWFDSQKGYGFISPEDGGENLFVHHSSIKSKGHHSLAEGERVEFEIEIDDRGRRKATKVSGPGGSFVQGTSGRDNRGIDFSMRGGRGPGDRIYGGRASTSRRGNSDNDASKCYKCGEMGHLARNCNGIGGGIGNNFRVRVDRGGGRKDYGSRASVSYRGGDSGRNRAAGVSSTGGSFLQETTSSNRESDTPKCDNCWKSGHLTINCDRRGGVSHVERLHNMLREMEIFPCNKCGELGHSSQECGAVVVSNGFNRVNTNGSYNSSDNRRRGGFDGGTNSGRGGSFELSNSRYNERNRAVSMRRPSGNLPRGNTRGGNHYGEIGNSTRDRPSTERGGGRSEDGVSSCTCGEAGHLPDCPKKHDSGSGAEVPCSTCHEPGHLPIDCPKKHQIWRELHFGF